MGRASNAKRERRDTIQNTPPPQPSTPRNIPVFWIVIGVLIVGALAALALTGGGDERAASNSGVTFTSNADVAVDGTALPPAPEGSGTDRGVGSTLPTITGKTMTGGDFRLGADSGPAVVVVMAHWCPHCQREIPKITEHLRSSPLPDGVRMFGVSTSASASRPNFPPGAWLEEEGWKAPTLADDEIGSAAEALATTSFPNILFIAADGAVESRASGEMDMDEFDERVRAIAPAGVEA